MSENTPSQAVTAPDKKKRTVKDIIQSDDFKAQVARALPRHMTPDRFLRIALTAALKTPKLLECTPESVCSCLLTCSQLGLEPDGRRAHLIPYGTTCTLVPDYKGLAELTIRTGLVSNLHADVVCENDVFEYDKGEIKTHTIDFRKPRGDVYAVYAICRLKDGSEKAEVMSKADVELIRQRSRSGGNGPWVTDWSEMAKKTVFKRLSKWLPMSPEVRDAIEVEDAEPINVTPTAAGAPIKTPSPILFGTTETAEEEGGAK